MKREELKQAINANALCEYEGIRYYVYGCSIIHEKGKPVKEGVILHSTKAKSIIYADYDKVTLLDS